jgi:membrane fusion protein (multidrug efflux system)
VKIAQKKVADCRITAAFDGVISIRHAHLGEWVNQGQKIFTLVQDDPIEIKGPLSEIYLGRLKLGMPVHVTVDGDAATEKTVYQTMLKEISAVVDPRQRTADLTVQLDNHDHRFKPGLFARMKIIFNQTLQAAPVIPHVCLLQDQCGSQAKVFVVQDNRAEIREIEIGIKEGEMIEVLAGLEKDDVVVIAGQDRLKNGQIVAAQERKAD